MGVVVAENITTVLTQNDSVRVLRYKLEAVTDIVSERTFIPFFFILTYPFGCHIHTSAYGLVHILSQIHKIFYVFIVKWCQHS